MKTVFLRVLEARDKGPALLGAIRRPGASGAGRRFEVSVASFGGVPRSPLAYWVSSRVLSLFADLPRLQANGRVAASGGKTLDDFRWIRGSWEIVPEAVDRWLGYAKGGTFSPYYADVHLLLDWRDDARALKTYLVNYRESRGWSPNWTAELHGSDHYRRPGLTWPRRTQSGLALRAMPAGCVFADKGPAAFVANDCGSRLLALLAVSNSMAFKSLVELQMAFGSFEVGVIQRAPVPLTVGGDESGLTQLAYRAWSSKRSLDTVVETSHAFTLPALLQSEGGSLAGRAAARAEHVRRIEDELAAIQAEIDERCFELYGINEEDRRVITEGFGGSGDASVSDDGDGDGESDDAGAAQDGVAEAVGLTAELAAWAVGVAFGRFDVRLATGERALPDEPEPFDPLPVCSPGMLTGDDGLPLTAAPEGYPLALPEDGIFVDDPGHTRDHTAAVRAVFDVVFGGDADARWREAAELFDPKERSLRTWLAKAFFEHHLKRYSKSRRKAPIIWQLATPSASYSVWLYAHRLTADSLFHVQNDVVAPKLALEERRHTALVQAAGPNPTASQRREIAEVETFVEELRVLLTEVRRVAPLWAARPQRRGRAHDGAALASRDPTSGVAAGAEVGLGCALRREVTTGRSSQCTSGPSASCRSAPRTAASRSPMVSRRSSGSRTRTGSGNRDIRQRARWRSSSVSGRHLP